MRPALFETTPTGNLRLEQPLREDLWIAPGIANTVTVPFGYETDGASIPRVCWPFIGPPIRGNHLIPAVIHDYLCDSATDYEQRVMADAAFFALLRRYNVSRWKRCAMYLAVRFYGRWSWRRKAGV